MLKAFDVSVAIFVRGLTQLDAILTKAESDASSRGIDPASLFSSRLAGDMYDLATQVHWAVEGSRLGVDRLLGVASKPPAPDAKTFADLHQRIEAAVAYLGSIDSEGLEAGLDRTIEIPMRGGSKSYRGDHFLIELAIPGFFFHVTTSYAILRHEGVPLQKGDFMGL